MPSRKCKVCGEILPLSSKHFHKKKDGKHGYRWTCKECRKNNYQENKEEISKKAKEFYRNNKHIKRNNDLKTKFGITLDQYNKMLENQNDICAICGGNNDYISLAVDHNHETGKIRGLLCGSCNGMLGLAKDNLLILIKGVKYLKGEIL